ncbi:hypothetical protein PG989_015124 [Apiospora arundinis]
MEAVVTVGLATNVFAFVEFAAKLWEEFKEDLVSLDNVAKRANKILDQLWFPDMLAREALVDNPAGQSHCWILQIPTKERESSLLSYENTDRKLHEEKYEQETTRGHFDRWLTSESGVFYISGKPRSGKSTSMKFLAQNKYTQQKLNARASDRQLVLMKFLFWI